MIDRNGHCDKSAALYDLVSRMLCMLIVSVKLLPVEKSKFDCTLYLRAGITLDYNKRVKLIKR